MRVLSREEAQFVDRTVSESWQVPLALLAENAGQGVAAHVRATFGEAPCLVLAGRGNNGADALIAARHLCESAAKVYVWLYDKGTCGVLYEQALACAKTQEKIEWVEDLSAFMQSPESRALSCVIEGLWGTGVRLPLREEAAKTLTDLHHFFNRWAPELPFVAIDMPAGVDCNTGQVEGEAFLPAFTTVTMGAKKQGQYLWPGRQHCGTVHVAGLGLGWQTLLDDRAGTYVVEAADLLKRDPRGHKGTYGHVAIVGGSPGLTGAPVLAALGAIHSGAGKVSLVSTVPAAQFSERPLELMYRGCGTWSEALAAVQDLDVCLLGPGLGRSDEAKALVEQFIQGFARPLVLDADALTVLGNIKGQGRLRRGNIEAKGLLANPSGNAASSAELAFDETSNAAAMTDAASSAKAMTDANSSAAATVDAASWPSAEHDRTSPIVITPHLGEFATLTGLSPKEVEGDRVSVARKFAVEEGCVLVLKGAPTVTALPDGAVYINASGNAGMASGGMGDVLGGVIASFLAQGMDLGTAVSAAVFIHGASGDELAKIKDRGFTASDVARHLLLSEE